MWNKYNIGLLLVLLFNLFNQNLVFTQEDRDFILVDSKLWDVKGDTTEGKLIYINQYNFQFNLMLADTSGNIIKHYSPKDLAGFYYFIDDRIEEYESMLNPVDIGKVFLRVLYRGSKSMYQFLDINFKSTVLSYLTYYYLWEDNWLDPPISRQNERSALLHHFSDCPELEYKIKTLEYNLSHIRLILNEYHECQLTDEYEFLYE